MATPRKITMTPQEERELVLELAQQNGIKRLLEIYGVYDLVQLEFHDEVVDLWRERHIQIESPEDFEEWMEWAREAAVQRELGSAVDLKNLSFHIGDWPKEIVNQAFEAIKGKILLREED